MAELRLEDSLVDERYRLKRCLSRGSYAEIFIAYDSERSGQEVIIKALNAFLQGTPDPLLEQTLVENFQNEAIALDKVRHPNIIRRLGHGTASDLEGTPFHYLVLEYMSGGDMLSLCRAHPIGIADTLFYFEQVCDGLSFAHSRNVIHRDIKPNNLLLTGDHKIIKIADFGVAKIAPDDTAEITRVGTNIYAPPEHHPDNDSGALHQPLTPSADIYSLAKTVYTALSGRAPHQFARRAITALPDNIVAESWSGPLLQVLEKATSSNASDRYQTVADFWAALAALQSYLPEALESDDEATLVRPRGQTAPGQRFSIDLKSSRAYSDHLSHAPRPNFQAVARPTESAQVAGYSKAADARIIVELPGKKPASPRTPGQDLAADDPGGQSAAREIPQAHLDGPGQTGARAGVASDPDHEFKTRPMASPNASNAEAPSLKSEGIRAIQICGYCRGRNRASLTECQHCGADLPGLANPAIALAAKRRPAAPAARASTAITGRVMRGLGNANWVEWLRRAFIVFLILFLISLVAKTYLFFADPSRKPSLISIPGLGVPPEEGAIYGASNVNIRKEPSGDPLAWLPAGSRVRVLETRGSWLRVKVLQWSGTPPVDAPDGGWIDRRYVKIDSK